VTEFVARVPAFTPEALRGHWDTILLCVKAQDTVPATHALAGHLYPSGSVVSVQNGLNEPVIAGIVGAERTVGCFINFGADYIEPGHITFGNRGAVVLGEIDGRITPRIRALHRLFLDFDDGAIMTDDIFAYLWGKMAYGMLLFATALTNETMTYALSAPAYSDMYAALAVESLEVARALGVKPKGFNGFEPEAFRPGADRAAAIRCLKDMAEFYRHSAKQRSGVWRDIAVRKRRTESVELEMVMDEGVRLGVPTPVTARLLELIHDVEEGRRPQGLETLDLLKASVA
jgi:2-dehydropantoate 2-reductase